MKKAALTLIALMFLTGCIKTVYVPYGQAVRLRETIKKAKVWVVTDEDEKVPGTMPLLEGWYCLSLEDPAEEEKNK